MTKIEEHIKKWKNCQICDISEYVTKKVIFKGDCPCSLLIVGEGPGTSEDLLGQPFVGPAGSILEEWIKRCSYLFGQIKIGISNLVCCRPTDYNGGTNRRPKQGEIFSCRPRLVELFKIAEPKVVLALGKTAQDNILFHRVSPVFKFYKIKHPAWVLRHGGSGSPADKECFDLFKEVFKVAKELSH